MLFPRVIPCLLLRGRGLVKTRRFADPVYVGDPINAIRIFNEKEVDELMLLDIAASAERRGPDLRLLSQVTSECFMPLAYGGGITSTEQMSELFALGIEKVVLNRAAFENAEVVRAGAERFGSQSIVVSIDVRRRLWGGYRVFARNGTQDTGHEPVAFARLMRDLGAGELLLTSIDHDGMREGYDLDLIRSVSSVVDIPVVASGGAGSTADLQKAVEAGASAAAAGSLFVFQGRHRAVLISFPARAELDALFGPQTRMQTVTHP
jgi:cyclase